MRRDYSAEQAGERRGEGGDEAAAEQHEAPQDQRVHALLRGAEAERGQPRAGLLGPEPRGRAVYGTRTSFPRTWPDSLARCASAARANGNASCTGRWKRPASMSPATSGSVSPARSAPAPPVTIT